MLPPDFHIHTEWSWDVLGGSMLDACARAVCLGLRAVAFTEHADFTTWTIPAEAVAAMPPAYQAMVGDDGLFRAPQLDVEGYLASVDDCRSAFPGLRIHTGIELGEPHWHPRQTTELLARHGFEQVIGSVHSLVDPDGFRVVDRMYGTVDPHEVVRRYLSEVLAMVGQSQSFEILGHVDYPLRAWPAQAGPVTVAAFEEEFRAVLAELADSGRTLELNTRLEHPRQLLRYWRECGGKWLSFGSDAHLPGEVARDFVVASAMAEAAGFRPLDDDRVWVRS
ncbi:PHP domain-containing protein [Solwaraspora sp. WMMA2065]|uniref:PHP domain-containing protein n=1 Tax=Solwaraspora sp. WMMA2065 TaxID=3015166 RepID=UPI00259B4D97|nr:PHP domain-containing protein [Solwaraspora sp. WMMA2065]WJK33084.1 PHP domain-containing protein [Solwaraspora sp. WMMA2065]